MEPTALGDSDLETEDWMTRLRAVGQMLHPWKM